MSAHTYDNVDLSSLEFWSKTQRERASAFAELRSERPVSFHEPIRFGAGALLGSDDPGFWAITTHELIRTVSRDPDTFCSSRGTSMEDVPPEMTEEMASFLALDGPQHHRLRRLVSTAFTPRNVARIEAQIARQAHRIVDHLIDVDEDCDFVDEVSKRLPMWTLAEMIGVPPAERDRLADAANAIVATNDPEFLQGGIDAFTLAISAVTDVTELALDLAQARRRAPADDLMTALVQAEIDGHGLTDKEIASFMVLLGVAGNDTTRQTTSHAMVAFQHFPDERARIAEDLAGGMPAAVEEMVRWATPVIQFRRTATHDTELGGQKIDAGDKVVLFYESANRDDTVFEDPWCFNLGRQPNDHVGFGGGGVHHCLGAQLARTQLRCLYTELLTRLPNLEVGEPEYLTGNFVHGIKRLPCRVGRVHPATASPGVSAS